MCVCVCVCVWSRVSLCLQPRPTNIDRPVVWTFSVVTLHANSRPQLQAVDRCQDVYTLVRPACTHMVFQSTLAVVHVTCWPCLAAKTCCSTGDLLTKSFSQNLLGYKWLVDCVFQSKLAVVHVTCWLCLLVKTCCSTCDLLTVSFSQNLLGYMCLWHVDCVFQSKLAGVHVTCWLCLSVKTCCNTCDLLTVSQSTLAVIHVTCWPCLSVKTCCGTCELLLTVTPLVWMLSALAAATNLPVWLWRQVVCFLNRVCFKLKLSLSPRPQNLPLFYTPPPPLQPHTLRHFVLSLLLHVVCAAHSSLHLFTGLVSGPPVSGAPVHWACFRPTCLWSTCSLGLFQAHLSLEQLFIRLFSDPPVSGAPVH